MKCKCGSYNIKVIDTRPNGDTIRRRRECRNCLRRWTTHEYIEQFEFVYVDIDKPVMLLPRRDSGAKE